MKLMPSNLIFLDLISTLIFVFIYVFSMYLEFC
jgi:hypothetical protein